MRTSRNPLNFLVPVTRSHRERTKAIVHANPQPEERKDAREVKISVFDYDAESINELQLQTIEASSHFLNNGKNTWINIDGIRQSDVESIASIFNIHRLIIEDILSIHQRPKMDDIEGQLYCLLNMLYFDKSKRAVEVEQISIILGKDYVISFQADATKDVFDTVRKKLMIKSSNVRQRSADYLLYLMLDLIVENYFVVMEEIGNDIEAVEEELIRKSTTRSLAQINAIRKEIIVLQRNITPVRDMISDIIRSESELINERSTKYFKDVYDQVIQAHELSENYRDLMMNMQDLYISNVNLKMNEVMKVMAIVTCLMAPATVIGGIFGMNFDVIPFSHHGLGFYLTVGFMLFIPILMLFIFKRRGWF